MLQAAAETEDLAAGAPKTLWEIPESKHVDGLQARPREYERRVVGFFDDALLR